MNFRIPRRVTSALTAPARLLTRIRQSCISSTRQALLTSSRNAAARSVHFPCNSSRSLVTHESFSVQQETKRFVVSCWNRVSKPATIVSRADFITRFVTSYAVRAASASISPFSWLLLLFPRPCPSKCHTVHSAARGGCLLSPLPASTLYTWGRFSKNLSKNLGKT